MFCNFIITIKSWQDSKAWFVPHNYGRKDFRCRVEKHSFSQAKKQPLGSTTLMSHPLLEENFFPQTTDCLQQAILAQQLGSGRMFGAVWTDLFQDCFMHNPDTFFAMVYCCETRFFLQTTKSSGPLIFGRSQTLMKVLLIACYLPKFTISSY